MHKIKKYFTGLPISFRNALYATIIVTALVALQSYIYSNNLEQHADGCGVKYFVFPILNYSIWLALAPFLFMSILKFIEPANDHIARKTKNVRLLGMSIAFSLVHEIIGVLLFNAVYALIHMDEVVNGEMNFNVLIGVFGFSKTYVEFWILYFVLQGLHSQKKARSFRLKNSQLEADLLKAQMSALKNQLHPHFLFNSFNTISSLMEENIDLAQRMISKLGALLRKILRDGDMPFISISEEIKLAKLYLEVEQIRFKGRLVTRFAIDPKAEKMVVPTLLLQPIIENAIKHGFYQKIGECEISIKISIQGAHVNIEITDNGGGMKNDSVFSFGIGLKNTKERLSRCYGNDYELSIDPQSQEGRFRVVIRILKEAINNEDIGGSH